MTKKDFEQFKKAIKKENEWFDSCAFYMTKRQEALHTATVALVGNFSFEKCIEYERDSIEKVNSYETWTSEEKKNHENRGLKTIAKYQERLDNFGTPENEAKYRFEQLKNSQAFKKLSDLGVSVELTLEGNLFYARFHY